MRNLLFITLFLTSLINVSVADEGKVWFCETKKNISLQRDNISNDSNFKFKFKIYKNKLVFKGGKVDGAELPLNMNSEINRYFLSDKNCFKTNISDKNNHDVFSFCERQVQWSYIMPYQIMRYIYAHCSTFD